MALYKFVFNFNLSYSCFVSGRMCALLRTSRWYIGLVQQLQHSAHQRWRSAFPPQTTLRQVLFHGRTRSPPISIIASRVV